jgi:hypothetical protein
MQFRENSIEIIKNKTKQNKQNIEHISIFDDYYNFRFINFKDVRKLEREISMSLHHVTNGYGRLR